MIKASDEGMIDPDTGEIERDYDVVRCEAWDDLADDPTRADWLRVGMGHTCDRCGYETHPEIGARAVGDEAVCEDCLTLADWDQIDPKYAAELRDNEEGQW